MSELAGRQPSVRALGSAAAVAASEEWRLAQSVRANLLIVDCDAPVQQLAEMLQVDRVSLAVWGAGQPLPPVEYTGTMLVPHVEALSPADQYRLHHWIEANAGRGHLVSMSARPLASLKEHGALLDALYYRLNIVCIAVGELTAV